MKFVLRLLLGLMILVLLCFNAFVIALPEGFCAVVTKFGKPQENLYEAGPHFIWPWPVGKAYIFDARSRVHNTRFTQTLTKDKKAVILRTYIVWKIKDPLVFLQSVATAENAERKLDSLVSSSKNNVLGNYELANLASTNADKLKLKEIENKIHASIAQSASKNFGIEISELGIKRLAYPENNVEAIFTQMRAERNQFASKYRAEGRMKASIIVSETDLEVARLKADARRKASEIKGKADREATEILAEAHKEADEFYRFSKSLEAIEKISGQNSLFILRSDQPPFSTLLQDKEEHLE
ncbi:MAG: protease modulator HflC [Candidatus Rifleibacteriota bacterium]